MKRRMRGMAMRVAMGLLFLAGVALSATAGTVSGTVTNGTTNKPVANADVILLQLQGGMEPVTTVKTDASGHFTITNDAIGTAPILLRVPYRGVLYHEPVPPGTATADVEVYEPTTDIHGVVVTTRAIVLQPKGSNLLVGEEYTINDQTSPPKAYYLKDGTFRFQLPDGAQLSQVTASGPSGMPVVQGTIDKGHNVEAVDWPFRPGENGIRIAYELGYGSNQARIHTSSPYAAQHVLLVFPPGLQVSSAGFSSAGTEQGYEVYSHDAMAANEPITIDVSGTAPEPAAASGDNGSDTSGNDAQNPSVNSRVDQGTTAMTTLPARLDNVKYILVAGFAALFALGVIFLWRRPVAATAGAAASEIPATKPKKEKRAEATSSATMAEVERGVSHSLDELKESLFRLELRHQAGTISDQDYTRERQKTEKILRELLRG